MGSPHAVGPCGASGSGSHSADCRRERSYISLLSFSDVWVVFFDRNDRVIGTTHLISP
jgi:hypothetical protein